MKEHLIMLMALSRRIVQVLTQAQRMFAAACSLTAQLRPPQSRALLQRPSRFGRLHCDGAMSVPNPAGL